MNVMVQAIFLTDRITIDGKVDAALSFSTWSPECLDDAMQLRNYSK
jgi:hypothetical protein